MKRTISLALCVTLVAMLLCSCVVVNLSPIQNGVAGQGVPESYGFAVGEISEIRVELFCDIEYYAAPSDTVTLEIQPNLREYITVEESGGVLTVRATRNIAWSNKAPILTVSTPALKRLTLAGAGTFTAHDTVTADSFTINFDGAGRGKAELDVRNLTVNIAGAGEFELSGKADRADFKMDGAGSLEALPLQTREATVSLSGVGTVRISCSENLRVNADGIGTVEYKGSPSVDLNNDGLVSVNKVG